MASEAKGAATAAEGQSSKAVAAPAEAAATPQQGAWKAAIVDCLEVTDAIRYIIEVTRGSKQWIIRKRYTDFVVLHKKLAKKFESYQLPFLPPKCYRLFGPDAEFLETRRSALQRYLDLLGSSKELSVSTEVGEFIAQAHHDRKASANAGATLPAQLPDVPEGDHDAATVAKVDTLLTGPRAAFRSLFLFRQALEVDPFLSNRIAIIDSRRRQMMSSAKTLRKSVPELEALAKEIEHTDSSLSVHLLECAKLTRVALKWIENIESEEGPLIKHFVKDAHDIRPVSWYEAQVAAALTSAQREEWGLTLPEPVQNLIEAIKVEREFRRQVGQLVAVQLLRDLQHKLSDRPSTGGVGGSTRVLPESSTVAAAMAGEDSSVARRRMSEAPPAYTHKTILDALQKRTRHAVANVDGVLSGISTGGDAEGVAVHINQLEFDLRELLQITVELRKLLKRAPLAEWTIPQGIDPPSDQEDGNRSDEDS